jgi:hypothetical protein
MFAARSLLVMVLLCASAWMRAAEPYLTEFMADNKDTLADVDHDHPDWIEIYNPNPVAISLAGWYLTDNFSELTKWQFPSVTVNANSYLVVFASGKDRTDPLQELHTNFSLDAGGEKLALVKPDGTTIVSQFTFGQQNQDVSYGLASVTTQQEPLVTANAAARALVPADNSLALTWTASGFDDGAWQSGTSGVGYDSNPDYLSYLGLNVGPAMNGVRTTCYMRIPFTVASLANLTGLKLRMRYDDGFVAYLNGTRIAARNEPATLAFDSAASAEHLDNEAVVFEDIDVSQFLNALVVGPNVLAIHGLNFELASSDFLIQPELTGTRSVFGTGFMPAPTPGAANSAGTLGFVDKVEFSATRGFYSAPFSVALGVDTPGAEIRYTRNGDTPTATTGSVYTGPLLVDKTTTLRAAAFKPGWTPGKVATHTYLFTADIIQQSPTGAAPSGFPPGPINGQVFDYGMDPNVVNTPAWGPQLPAALTSIPSISVVTDGANLFDPATGIYVNAGQRPDGTGVGDDWERPTSIELIYGNGTKGFQENAGLRIRGNFSREDNNAKHGFKVVFKKEFGPGKLDFPLFGNAGAREIDRFDLRTMQDNSWSNPYYGGDPNMHAVQDPFCRVLMRDLGQPYTRGFFVHLYLNGQYWGLYNIEERPVRGWAEAYLGGKADDYDVLKVNANQNYTVGATDGNTAAWQQLLTYALAGFSSGNANYWAIQGRDATGANDPAKPALLDLDNFIAYMVANFYVGNHDGPISADLSDTRPNNFFVLRDRTDRHRRGFVCVTHDMERTLLDVGENRHITSSVGNTIAFFNPQYLHLRLKLNPEYTVRFGDCVHRVLFNNGAATVTNATARFTTLTNEISLAIIGESARWGDANTEPPRTKTDWQNAVNSWLANYFPNRTATALSQFRTAGLYPVTNAPVFAPHGGAVPAAGLTVAITENNTGTRTTYVTTDGSDPRALGGGVGPTAFASAGSVSIPAGTTTVLRSRVLKSGAWSALNEAVYAPASSPLRITEILFHPSSPTTAEVAAGYADADDFEFIELQNTGAAPLKLFGYRFTAGVDFTFGDVTLPADAHCVLARNKAALQFRYGVTAAGEYLGDLDDAGDHLTLVDALGNVVLDFDYGDHWFSHADGGGYSLVIRDPLGPPAAWQNESGWRASTASGGSPGAADPASPAPGSVVINEVLAHTTGPLGRWIELRNVSANPVDLSGWHLSDDEFVLAKYQFPSGMTLAAGASFVVFEYGNFGPTAADPGRLVAFSLSEHGGEVWLSSPSGGYREHVDFGAAANGVSFGRHVKSTGATDFAALSTPTMGAANAAPLVGPAVFSEIQFHPPAADGEYLELRNLTGAGLPLDGWKITGGVDWTFATGATLPAHGYGLVVGMDPAAFRTAYGIPAAVPIFGPWYGVLDNDGEQVELKKPAGNGDFISVDRVNYSDTTPWPNVSGNGFALARQPVQAYGNDPASWLALPPTRGASNTADTDGDGLPDAWELANGLHPGFNDSALDADGDGQANLAEYLAGTNPQNPTSNFHVDSATRTGGIVQITFTAQPGKTYTVQYRDSLSAGNWLKLADVPAPASAQSTTVNDNSPPPTQRFYRVVTPAQ